MIRTRTAVWPPKFLFGLLLVAAAGTVDASEESVELDAIQVTAGRLPESQSQVPKPVTVIDRATVETIGPGVVAEALRGASGAFVQQSGPGQGIVIVRGLKGSEVLHLVDGMRLNNAFFRNSPSQYFALVDPQNIQQIELLRGPQATLYGSDAMGGVVHVLTPEERFDSDSWLLRGGNSLRYSSADLGRSTRSWLAVGNREFSVSGGYSFSTFGKRLLAEPGQSPDGSGGVRIEDRVNDTHYLSRAWDVKLLWSPTIGHDWMLSTSFFEVPELDRYFQTVPGYSNEPPARSIARFLNDRTFYHLRYRYSLPLLMADDIEIHLAHQIINDDRLDRRQDGSRDDFTFNRSDLTGFTLQADLERGTHELRYGVEVYSDRIESRAYREAPPNSGSITFPDGESFFTTFPDGSRSDDIGAFVFDEWRPDNRWLIESGLRATRHRTVVARGDRAFGVTLAHNDVTGNLGLRFLLTRSLGWTLNLGRGFRAPNLFDLAQVGQRANNRVVVANLDLKPESVTTIDTGLKFNSPGAAAEFSVFVSDYNDRIETVNPAFAEGTPQCPDDGDDSTDGCAQNQNIAESLYYGFEGGWRLAPSPNFILRGTLNYTWGAQEQGGRKDEANRVPPINGLFAAELLVGTGLSVRSSVYFAGRQDRLASSDESDSRINPQGTPGFAVLNADLLYEPLSGLLLQLGGRNLLGAAYREHGSGIDGLGRGLVAGLRYRF